MSAIKKMFLIFVATTTILTVSLVNGECSIDCPKVPKHYEELGCVAIKDDNGCCPIRFECPDFNSYDKEKCHFKGKSYEKQNQIDDEFQNDCITHGCICSGFGDNAAFSCPQINCPDVFQPNCIVQRELGKCCPVKPICDENIINSLPICWFENKKFQSGQLMYPDGEPCYVCSCNEHFSNASNIAVNNNCKKLECGVELLHLDEIRNGCVPVYFGTDRCCPIEYNCPTDKDVSDSGRSIDLDEENSKQFCQFGEIKIPVGESINVNKKCTTCSCRVPPMVECIKTSKC